MTTIDPTTNLGRLRLRCADLSDIPFLPDAVYNQTLIDNNNNLPVAAKVCATYILGMLAFKTDRKMGLQLQVWGSQAFEAYKQYLLLTVTNPAFMTIEIMPINLDGNTLHPLIQFQQDWNLNYSTFTQSQQMNWDALGSPSSTGGWEWPG